MDWISNFAKRFILLEISTKKLDSFLHDLPNSSRFGVDLEALVTGAPVDDLALNTDTCTDTLL